MRYSNWQTTWGKKGGLDTTERHCFEHQGLQSLCFPQGVEGRDLVESEGQIFGESRFRGKNQTSGTALGKNLQCGRCRQAKKEGNPFSKVLSRGEGGDSEREGGS